MMSFSISVSRRQVESDHHIPSCRISQVVGHCHWPHHGGDHLVDRGHGVEDGHVHGVKVYQQFLWNTWTKALEAHESKTENIILMSKRKV